MWREKRKKVWSAQLHARKNCTHSFILLIPLHKNFFFRLLCLWYIPNCHVMCVIIKPFISTKRNTFFRTDGPRLARNLCTCHSQRKNKSRKSAHKKKVAAEEILLPFYIRRNCFMIYYNKVIWHPRIRWRRRSRGWRCDVMSMTRFTYFIQFLVGYSSVHF